MGGIRPLDEGSAPLSRLSARGVNVVRSDINAIDAEARSVETSAGVLKADAISSRCARRRFEPMSTCWALRGHMTFTTRRRYLPSTGR